jgi:hypothetical protein
MMPWRLWGTATAITGGLLLVLANTTPSDALSAPPTATTTPTPTPTPSPTGTSPTALIYVANADSGPVTAYTPGSSGAVTPVRTVSNPQNPNTVWDPWGVTFDNYGNLYVQTFLSDATTFVFPPGANATTPPSRIFQANAPDNRSVAVDAHGYEYVAGGEAGWTIAVEPPGASGVPGSLYHVPPLRTITLNDGFIPWPSILTTDNQNEVLGAVTSSQANSIEIFAGGATGSSTPVRTISGPDTGLGSCGSPCAELSIAYSPSTGRIYAAVSDGTSTHISVFAGYASGDALPIQTIEGPSTGLSGNAITGLAVSQTDGTIYAMVKSSQFGTGQVIAYAQLAQGNATPLRSFTDANSAFADAAGIAISR